MSDTEIDLVRRKLLKAITGVIGAATVAAAAIPFVKALWPVKATLLSNEAVTVDIQNLQIGEMLTIQWRRQPVWIIKRSAEEIAALRQQNPSLQDANSTDSEQPDFARNAYRSLVPEILIVIGLCTHLGCIPNFMPKNAALSPKWSGGFLCPCHGSRYDLAGRVFKHMSAPMNLKVPPYHFLNPHTVVIGA